MNIHSSEVEIMATERQIAANRANAAKSSGPKTLAGKRNSSRNGIHHGLLAQSIVLKGESAKRFRALLSAFREDFQPRNSVEASLVETMAVARWRQMRWWAPGAQRAQRVPPNSQEHGRPRGDRFARVPQARARLDHETDSFEAGSHNGATRVALALESLTNDSRSLELMNRYETCYDRQYSRALNNLLRLREKSDFSKRTQFSNGDKSL